MKFASVPVNGIFRIGGVAYRKENTFGKSRMLHNATRLRPGENPRDPNREWDWVFFDLETQVPFPDHHCAQVTSLIGQEVRLHNGLWRITTMEQNGPPNCEIRYQLQSLVTGDGDATDWYAAKELQRLGVEVAFLPPEDTRPEWMKNMAERDYDPALDRSVFAVQIKEHIPEPEVPEEPEPEPECNGRKKRSGVPRAAYPAVPGNPPKKRGRPVGSKNKAEE